MQWHRADMLKQSILMVCWTLASAHFLSAATYYVNSNTGSDTNAGTNSAAPWLTLHMSIPKLSPGDTLNCTGTFSENAGYGSHYNFTVSGTAGNPITIKSYGAGATIDMVCGGDFCNYNFTGSYLAFDGFKITTLAPGNLTGAFSFSDGTSAMNSGGGSHIIIRNCEVSNVSAFINGVQGGDRVWIFETAIGSSFITFTNLYFHDITDADLTRIWGTRHLITHCVISNCTNPNYVGSAIHADLIQCGGNTSLSNVFECNLLISNTLSGGDLDCTWGGGPCASDARDWVYRNNIFVYHGSQSIQDFMPNFHAYNNVFYHWNGRCITEAYTGTNMMIYNNVFINDGVTDGTGVSPVNYNAWDAVSFSENQWVAMGPSNIVVTDPGFVNAAAGDFHLLSTSPLRGAGINLTSDPSASITDMDGNARPSTGAWDIGAYQYAAAGPVTNAASSPPPPGMMPSLTVNQIAPLTIRAFGTVSGMNGFRYDFGDGNSSTNSNPIHAYTNAEAYIVALTTTNGLGQVFRAQVGVTVTP
jgi:PKD domain